ncbi:MAG: hydrolase [Armatimonadetes bacterium]|nr:hydrolase [Armatimonadota bacterium]MDW8122478.1 hydrolase [Armatimonadota bacterium]
MVERLHQDRAVLIVVDLQEKFLPVLYEPDRLVERAVLLIKGLKVLKVPMLVTEQSPEKLGLTVEPVREALGDFYRPISKTSFSPLGSDEFRRALAALRRDQILYCGIEAHVCVLQGVLQALAMGYKVFVVQDALSSRFPEEISIAVSRMSSAGAVVVSTEMVLYELLQGADHPAFREVQSLIKESARAHR